eukprot:scaffold109600_cov44-Phaeocystis_antarctica.AAC.1
MEIATSSLVSSVLVATMGQGLFLGLASRACPEQCVSVLLVALCAQSTPCAFPRGQHRSIGGVHPPHEA